MDSEELAAIDSMIGVAVDTLDKVSQLRISWEALDFSSNGTKTLFDQFKKAGAWAEFINAKISVLEQEKLPITELLKDRKALFEKQKDEILKKQSKDWVAKGYAYQERLAFASIEAGDPYQKDREIESRLSFLDGHLALLRVKARQFSDFKADAKVAVSIMNFGHLLGELK